MTKSKAAKHADGSSLVRRGNYTLLRLLIITKAAGPDGITTLALLNELGSKADHINHIINNAEKAGYIKRVKGESENGHFPPVYNILTAKGKRLLANLSS